MRLRAHILVLVVIAATAGPASAQATQPAAATSNLIHRSAPLSPNASPGAAPSSGASGTRVFVSLATVLGLIGLLYWGSRRMLPPAGAAGGAKQAVQVLSRTHVSAKQKILLIQVGRRVLVVGDSGQQLNTLCEISDADEAAALVAQVKDVRSAGASASVTSALSTAASRFRRAAEEPATAEDDRANPNDLATTQQELDGLLQRVRRIATQMDRA